MNDELFNQISKALADPQRFAILERIARQANELACKKLVDEFDVSQATISHHLKELTTAGLIEGRREGQFMLFSPRRSALAAYQSELAKRLSAGS
ncbi:MAG: metalloregulator ArsR/SmtB family transcription factor [Planctomycetota bacterium]|nr:metalloregulator ArsR/SmtB family transcription factor [Planctomycetota bacterium]